MRVWWLPQSVAALMIWTRLGHPIFRYDCKELELAAAWGAWDSANAWSARVSSLAYSELHQLRIKQLFSQANREKKKKTVPNTATWNRTQDISPTYMLLRNVLRSPEAWKFNCTRGIQTLSTHTGHYLRKAKCTADIVCEKIAIYRKQ